MNPFSKQKKASRKTPKLPQNAEALFFLSTGRTGTTTVARALDTVKGFTAVHEPEPKLFLSRYHIHQEGRYFADWVSRDFETARAEAISHVNQSGKIYVESSAFLSFHTPSIARLMPNATFIYLYRHPFDFVRSGMRRNWYKSHPNDYCRLVPITGTETAEKWKTWDRFNKICWLWSEFNEHCLQCYDLIPDNRKLKLASEELWENPERCGKDILALAGHSERFNRDVVTQLTVKHNAQTKNEFTMPSEWTDAQKNSSMKICSATMIKLGYDI